MNERLHDMMMEATKDMPQCYYVPGMYFEQFAELLIKECVQAFETEVDTWKQMDPYQGSIKRQGTKAIKEHFGVE